MVNKKEAAETKTETRDASSWIVVGIVALAAAGIYLLMSRRRREESLTIYDRDIPTVQERVVTGSVKTVSRPGPPVTHQP